MVCKLLQNNHGQTCGETQYHIVGSYPSNHSYCTILHECLHTIYYTICLITIHNHAALLSTIKSIPLFSTPSCCTLKPSHRKSCVSMHDSHSIQLLHYPHNAVDRAMYHLNGALLPCWRSIQEQCCMIQIVAWGIGIYLYTPCSIPSYGD